MIIADRGASAHMLMSIVDYRRPAVRGQKIAALLALPGSEDIELDIRPRREPALSADLS